MPNEDKCKEHDKDFITYCKSCKIYLCNFCLNDNEINKKHFWLMILQGFSRHMEINKNSKGLRHKFVDFEGHKNIYIESKITNLFMASDEQ